MYRVLVFNFGIFGRDSSVVRTSSVMLRSSVERVNCSVWKKCYMKNTNTSIIFTQLGSFLGCFCLLFYFGNTTKFIFRDRWSEDQCLDVWGKHHYHIHSVNCITQDIKLQITSITSYNRKFLTFNTIHDSIIQSLQKVENNFIQNIFGLKIHLFWDLGISPFRKWKINLPKIKLL